MRNILRAAALVAAVIVAPGAASAAASAVATADVNMRAGPGTGYPVIRTVPRGAPVTTYGCLADYSWCDTSYAGGRGWVSAHYLNTVVSGTTVVVGPRVGLPIVVFNTAYWDRYYTSYGWYHYGPGHYGPPPPHGPPPPPHHGGNGHGQCGPRGCAGTVTGPHGGTASGAHGCGPRGCAGGGRVTGPNGGSVTGGHACGPRGCVGGRRVVGPNGGTRTRIGGVRW